MLRVEIVDQDPPTGPLERIWADHRVDFEAPRFVGISQSGLHISPGGAELRGYAYDDSAVPHLTVEVRRPDGGTATLPCPNPNPAGGTWTCDGIRLPSTAASHPLDGQAFQVRLRATDGAGLTGEPGPWQPFIVDTVPPTVTAQLSMAAATGLPASLQTLRLQGRLADNHGAAAVRVCLEGTCHSAATALQGAPRLHGYTDEPAAPLPWPPVARHTSSAPSSSPAPSTVRAVGLGIRAEHHDRDQIPRRARFADGHAGPGSVWRGGPGQRLSALRRAALRCRRRCAGPARTRPRPGPARLPHVARPDEPLSAFAGEGAAGTWTFILCDTVAGGDTGSYLGRPAPTPGAGQCGTRRQMVPQPVATRDGRRRTDRDGLRSGRCRQPHHRAVAAHLWSTTWRPKLRVTHAISEVRMTPDLAPLGVLTGTVSDGGGVQRLFALVRTPCGQLQQQPVTRDDEAWSFPLRTMTAGTHAVYVAAEDLAGNRTFAGPFAVAVAGIHFTASAQVYLPVILRGSVSSLRQNYLWLPLLVRGFDGAEERLPGLEVTTPTATVVITPTATITPWMTTTPKATTKPTATITPTGTLTPTLTLTPPAVETPRPTRTLTPTLTLTTPTTGTPTASIIADPHPGAHYNRDFHDSDDPGAHPDADHDRRGQPHGHVEAITAPGWQTLVVCQPGPYAQREGAGSFARSRHDRHV